MSEEKPNLYEGMYIISATLSEEARAKAVERIQNGITERGGEVHKTHEFGRRRLAYEVAGHREGHYFVLYFTVKPSAIAELWDEYQLNEDLIRSMTFRTDKIMEEIKFAALSEAE